MCVGLPVEEAPELCQVVLEGSPCQTKPEGEGRSSFRDI